MLHTLCLLLVLLTADQAESAYPRADLLISAADLARDLRTYRVLDTRSPAEFRQGHVPGAIQVEVPAWTKAFGDGQDLAGWQERLGKLGLDADTKVVVVGDDVRDAARAWWILRYWGLRDVRLLNGGWAAWQGPKEQGAGTAPAAKTTRLAPQSGRLATKAQMLDVVQGKKTQILDVRSKEEFCGENPTAKRNGAMPGAKHLEWVEVLDPKTQRFKSADELRKLFQGANTDLGKPSVTYCQSGGRAAVMAFALELMGARDVRNYYRSWAEWGNAPDTPVVKP